MVAQFLLVLSALAVVPGATQPSLPKQAAVAPLSTSKPCEPIAPEAEPDGNLIYTGCQIKALGGSVPKLLEAPKDPDLSKLYRKGIQGEIIFSLVIGKDGLPRNIAMKQSSRSPELDTIGMEIVNKTIFSPATDQAGKAVNTRAIYPIYFWKDSIRNNEFLKKKCDQFLIDTNWHQENFPEERPDQYRGWLLANGMFFAASVRAGNRKTLAYGEVVEICRNNPNKLFLEVLAGK